MTLSEHSPYEDDRLILSEFFDAAFYLEHNSDVREAQIDPTWHYMVQGWKEGRAPNKWFNGTAYLALHADVAALDMDPLLHYARHGRAERRALGPPPSVHQRPHAAMRTLIEQAVSAHERARDYPPFPVTGILTPASLAARLLEGAPSGILLSASHDDYAVNFGGVQRLMSVESGHYKAANWCYVHLAPAHPLPILSQETELAAFQFRVRVDGELVGTISAIDLIGSMERVKARGIAYDLVIHHFMGHSPEVIQAMCAALEIEHPYIWLHDFFTLCESYNLLRNDWKFCHAPPAGSMGCNVCVYGPGRASHFARMQHVFDALQPIVLVPSAAALQAWQGRGLAASETQIVPIARLVTHPTHTATRNPAIRRIAFIGQSSHAKGWNTYRALASQAGGRADMEFWHLGMLGAADQADPRIRSVPVQAHGGDREAMVRALAAYRIDLVVLWPAWPETFSYVVHEALAAGAAVITHSHAGNIPSVLKTLAPNHSLVLNSEAELFELFASDVRLAQLCGGQGRLGIVLPYESSAHVTLHRRLVEHVPAHVPALRQSERAHG